MRANTQRLQTFCHDLSTSTVERYFLTMNEGQFRDTAHLFALKGILAPPFLPQIKGQRAIADYMEKTAGGISMTVFSQTSQRFRNSRLQVDVQGRVKTRCFETDTAWTFLLNPDGNIALLQIKLHVSLKKLNQLYPYLYQVACG